MHKLRDETAATAPAPGGAAVWRVNAAAASPARWEDFLSQDERRRANAMADRAARRQYLAGRMALRVILAHYTGRPPADLEITIGPHQKPELAATPGGPVWPFSLAHTRGMILIAVSGGGPIGVDVELRRRRLHNFEGLIRRILTPAECAQVQSCPPARRRERLLHYWTAKEACLKAIGTGLARAPKTLQINFLNKAEAACCSGPGADVWRLSYFSPAPGFLAAIAGRTPCRRLTLLEFPLDLPAAVVV